MWTAAGAAERKNEGGKRAAKSRPPSSYSPSSLGVKRKDRRRRAPSASSAPGPSRHNSSLGVLTTKFADLVRASTGSAVDLNEACVVLSVEKRRLYDIANVLEGAGLMEKRSKSFVAWRDNSFGGEDVAASSATMTKELDRIDSELSCLDDWIDVLRTACPEEDSLYLSTDDVLAVATASSHPPRVDVNGVNESGGWHNVCLAVSAPIGSFLELKDARGGGTTDGGDSACGGATRPKFGMRVVRAATGGEGAAAAALANGEGASPMKRRRTTDDADVDAATAGLVSAEAGRASGPIEPCLLCRDDGKESLKGFPPRARKTAIFDVPPVTLIDAPNFATSAVAEGATVSLEAEAHLNELFAKAFIAAVSG